MVRSAVVPQSASGAWNDFLGSFTLSICILLPWLLFSMGSKTQMVIFVGAVVGAFLNGLVIHQWFLQLRYTWAVCFFAALTAFANNADVFTIVSSFLSVITARIIVETMLIRLPAQEIASRLSSLVSKRCERFGIAVYFMCLAMVRFPKIFSERCAHIRQLGKIKLLNVFEQSFEIIYNGICYLPFARPNSGYNRFAGIIGLLLTIGLIVALFCLDLLVLS